MKIGILTFHWATNYGAVLQCYALQSYLESLGHEVKIIDYKPRQNDDSLYGFFRFRKFLYIHNYIENRKKEKALTSFRKEKLNQTCRVYSYLELSNKVLSEFDVVISGSDQVLNPSFLMHGERRGFVSPTYFLGFPFEGKKIGYALSFGCVYYPQYALSIASKYIKEFDYISVREKTGIDIVSSMGREDGVIVPDPTLLKSSDFYHKLADEFSITCDQSYIYNFFIRHISERKTIINPLFSNNTTLWNNDDGEYSMQSWLFKIKHAKFVVTDSFHCMVMCLKLHIPFAVVTESKGNVGMNDRFYTLLGKMSLYSIIIHKDDINLLSDFSNLIFDWDKVDRVLSDYLYVGEKFLLKALS